MSLFKRLQRLRDEVEADTQPAFSFFEVVQFSGSEDKRQTCLKRVKQNNKKLERLVNARTARTLVTDNKSTMGHLAPPGKKIRQLLRTLYGAISKRWVCSYGHQALLSLMACCKWSEKDNARNNKLDLLISTHFSQTSHWQEGEITLRYGEEKSSGVLLCVVD